MRVPLDFRLWPRYEFMRVLVGTRFEFEAFIYGSRNGVGSLLVFVGLEENMYVP